MNLKEMLLLPVKEKRNILEKFNQSYRTGAAIVSDEVYDAVFDSLPDGDEFRNKVGVGVPESSSRKANLPIIMASMNKVKSMEELTKWSNSKGINDSDIVVITPKYDGLSFLHHYGNGDSWTRGDGVNGQKSNDHFNELNKTKQSVQVPELIGNYLIGEVIMSSSVFLSKYSGKFKNSRNLVAGLFNSKYIDPALKDVDYIVYGVGDEWASKSEMLLILNKLNKVKVPFKLCEFADLSDAFLKETFTEWTGEFEIDGLILELNDLIKRKAIGREKNNNPCYARAWKGFSEANKKTTIKAIAYNITKEGHLSMVANLQPVELDGVTVSNVTLYNASTCIKNRWGVGAEVIVIRSGKVIPKIIKTLTPVTPELPLRCPSCNFELQWDENLVHLLCANSLKCRAQKIQSIIFFFEILDVNNVGEGVVEQLYKAGYTSVSDILKAKKSDLEKLEGFAEQKTKVVFESIHEKVKGVALQKIQHASGLFKGLGTKKLALVNEYNSPEKIPSFGQLLQIDGFSEISAKSYLSGIRMFWKYLTTLPSVTINCDKKSSGDKCKGMIFIFTGFRNKELEKRITDEGGKIGSSVSKKTTHLIATNPKSKSAKIDKARLMGTIIWDIQKLNNFLATK